MSRKTLALVAFLVVASQTWADEPAVVPSTDSGQPRTLTFEERVAAQRAIEEVYWRHRIWPGENSTPEPPVQAVMPESTLRRAVEDYLKKSSALEALWRRPITAAQLQAEIDRMTASTRSPEVLRELFSALGNDPSLVAETLARQTLVDRLVRSRYARDARFHGEVQRRAMEAVTREGTAARMNRMGGRYHESTISLATSAPPQIPFAQVDQPTVRSLVLGADDWRAELRRLRGLFRGGSALDRLPLRELSPLVEEDDSFVIVAVLEQSPERLRVASVSWPKVPFDDWWEAVRSSIPVFETPAPGTYTLPQPEGGGCQDDTWTLTGPPDARYGHATVWTGTEMIIWGGGDGYRLLGAGGRYNPSTDTWSRISSDGEPTGAWQTAVWTGTEMIVWGGGDQALGTGGRYDPQLDRWLPMSTIDAPAGRSFHTAVWTGAEMLVWGGRGSSLVRNTGGRYNPSTDSWRPTSLDRAPAARDGHSAVWTGSEMIVWGGFPLTNTGGRYDPVSDTWTPIGTGAGVPAGQGDHVAVWTGTEMIVWGFGRGGRYDPASDTWTPTSTTDAPLAISVSAVWTGSEMIVWGGLGLDENYDFVWLNTGARYDPVADSWAPTSTTGAPEPRGLHSAVWTGSEMIVWGGYRDFTVGTGGRYNPLTDDWVSTTVGLPEARRYYSTVWTGAEMIVWGGERFPFGYLDSGARYDVVTDSWTSMSRTHAPTARALHAAIWTGSEMIVWGGLGLDENYDYVWLNTGARYDPVADSWAPTSTTGAPEPRGLHSAVWTGSEMIVWGGTPLNPLGGRYDPASDRWRAMTTVAAPAPRSDQTAIWTGSEMIVWGGYNITGPDHQTGGRYDPLADLWVPTSIEGAPSGRHSHSAIWTGTEMIIWGGFDTQYLNSGARYDPVSDSWTETSLDEAPAARQDQSAIWTGSEMIVWGGFGGGFTYNSGGTYNPSTDSWLPVSSIGAPTSRAMHSAVWFGNEMIVWGGGFFGFERLTNTGGRYCRCPLPTPSFRDLDQDSHGDPEFSVTTCDGSIPLGYVSGGSDCNDSDPSVHPGAPEACDGIDNDCNGLLDDETEPPAIECPADATLECPADTSPGATGFATASDNCGEPSSDHADVVETVCGLSSETVRTWTATDPAGNQNACSQSIVVADTTPPALALPPPLRLECSAEGGITATEPDVLAWFASAAAADACGDAILIHEAPAFFPLGQSPAVFRAVDPCGNEREHVALITVSDTMAPSGSITFPTPDACHASAVTLQDTFTDLCDPSISRDYDPAGGPTYGVHGDHTVTLTASDSSGNAASSAVSFTIDTMPPVIAFGEVPGSPLENSRELPLRFSVKSSDNDGASGEVTHERVTLGRCTVFDGAVYGDGDGILHDEILELTRGEFCDLVTRCGVGNTTLFVAEATDCGGNVGTATRRYTLGDLLLMCR